MLKEFSLYTKIIVFGYNILCFYSFMYIVHINITTLSNKQFPTYNIVHMHIQILPHIIVMVIKQVDTNKKCGKQKKKTQFALHYIKKKVIKKAT